MNNDVGDDALSRRCRGCRRCGAKATCCRAEVNEIPRRDDGVHRTTSHANDVRTITVMRGQRHADQNRPVMLVVTLTRGDVCVCWLVDWPNPWVKDTDDVQTREESRNVAVVESLPGLLDYDATAHLPWSVTS
jgi:hypothetical protein